MNGTPKILCAAQVLYAKQGRSSQFGSRQERDAFIQGEVKQLETAAAVSRSSHAELQAQIGQLSGLLMDLSQVPCLACFWCLLRHCSLPLMSLPWLRDNDLCELCMPAKRVLLGW